MFVLVIGATEISKIPGISAAGANPDILPYTAPADADMLWWGMPRVVNCIPLDPQGHPTPAIITRAACLEAGFPVTIIKSGTSISPLAPHIETGAEPGKNPVKGPAVPDAEELFQRGVEMAINLSCDDEPLVIGESIPGGTTTAALVLRALGKSGAVSSAGPENPLSLKEQLCQESFKRAEIMDGDMKGQALAAVREFGDPMQPLVAGIVAGTPVEKEITLAGGTQMLAVAALIRDMGIDRPLTVATTCYVERDSSADFKGLADKIGVDTWAAPLDFSKSPWTGLSDYEKGYVKEGVGAGGSVWYAEKMGVPVEQIIQRVESLYEDMISDSE